MLRAKKRPKSKGEYNKYLRTGNILDMNYQAKRRYVKSLQATSQEQPQGPGESLFSRAQNMLKESMPPKVLSEVVPHVNVTDGSETFDVTGGIVQQEISDVNSNDHISMHDVPVLDTEKDKVELVNESRLLYEPYPTMAAVIESLVGSPCREALAVRDPLCYPKSFNVMINDDNFLKTIDISVATSSGEVLLMALKYALHNELSASGLIMLLRFANCLFQQPILFDTKYMLDKIFNPTNNAEFHAVCPTCKTYIGELTNLESFVTCTSCKENVDLSTPSCSNFFVILNPADAVEDLLNQHIDYYNYVVNERVYEKGHIKDILDGKSYRQFVHELPEAEKKLFNSSI